MRELIERLADKAGLEESVAVKTIGIILGFLRTEGPSEPVQHLIDTIPGAEAAIDSASESNKLLGRMAGRGVMAMGAKLMGLGLNVVDIRTIAHELFRIGRDRIGADQMAEILAGTPGLRQFA